MTKYPENRESLELKPEMTEKIDILIEKGLYPNYVDFLEKAIESQFNLHEVTFQEVVKEKDLIIGLAHYSAKELEAIVAKGKKLELKVLGSLKFSEDVTPTLIERSIDKISLTGILNAPVKVKTILDKKRFTFLGQRYYNFKRFESREK